MRNLIGGRYRPATSYRGPVALYLLELMSDTERHARLANVRVI